MKQLKLTQGKVAIVDDEDFNRFGHFKWHYLSVGYAARRQLNSSRTYVYLHRLIMKPEKGQEIDHINGNTLDNRKSNLRIADRSKNMSNTRIRKTNTSGYKGVSLDKSRNMWAAEITVNYKKLHLGRFNEIKEAAKAYNEAAKKYFGEFAYLNSL